MRINKLASAISRGTWLMEPRTAHGLVPMAVKFLNHEDISHLSAAPELPVAYAGGEWQNTAAGTQSNNIWDALQPNSVAVIPVCGAIMKDDYCGSSGTDTLAQWIKQAGASANVSAIVLKINSGGGEVAGTGELADVIKASKKPVIAFTDGLMASAAYWIGSACVEVYASHKTVEVGSIGTMVSFMDDTAMLQKQGYREHIINADTSPDKNQDYLQAMQGQYGRIKVNILNPTNNIFMGAVMQNRAGKLRLTNVLVNKVACQEPLTGKVYLAEAAIANGLIDGIKTLDAVIERAIELTHDSKSTPSMNAKSKKKVAANVSVLDKMMAFIAGVRAEENAAKRALPKDMADDEDEDEDDDADASKPAKPAKKDKKPQKGKPMPGEDQLPADDEDDDLTGTDDEDEDDDKDEEELKTENKQLRAEVARLKAKLSEQNSLLKQASESLKASNVQLQKNAEELKREIKSSFTFDGSKRSNKARPDANALPDFLKPTEGSLAEKAMRVSVNQIK